MKYSCLKTGFEPFDSMHAIGLGLFLWSASSKPVRVESDGSLYQVIPDSSIEIADIPAIFADLLPLITPQVLEADKECEERATYVLDGALAWLFTSPGIRVPSVASVRRKAVFNLEVTDAAISKWARLRAKVLSGAERICRQIGKSAERVLAGYEADTPCPLSFGPRPSGGFGIPLVLEPALGYAYRHPLADGEVSDKTNVAVLSPPLASLLILLGAIYSLRGKEVAGRMVHIYAPIIEHMVLDGAIIMPCLPTTTNSSDEELMELLLRGRKGLLNVGASSIAYQILQTQVMQQSFSLGQGLLNLGQHTSSTQDLLSRRWMNGYGGFLTLQECRPAP